MSAQASFIFATMLWVLATSPAQAVSTDHAFSAVPSRFQSRQLSVSSRGLGEICLSRFEFPDGTVCNPALLGDVSEANVSGRVFLGNGYAALATADQFVFKPLTKEFLQSLFRENNVTSLEAETAVQFTTRHFSASFSPYRVQYLSEVHNPNYPVVAVHAAVERSFDFAGGAGLGTISEELASFSLGARLRILERNYVHGSFSFFEAVSEDPRKLLPVHTQRAVFLDPSLAWTGSGERVKPRFSVGASNLGKSWPANPLYQEPTDLNLGAGVDSRVGPGNFGFGLDVVQLMHGENLGARLRAGTSYRFGILEALGGASANGITGAMQFRLSWIRAGIVYEFSRKDIEQGSTQSRIATEMAIAL